MERTPREQAEKLMKEFTGKKIVRADGKISQPAEIFGITAEGNLVIMICGCRQLCWCPLNFTDDNWKEA